MYDYTKDFEDIGYRQISTRVWYRQWWGILIIVLFIFCFVGSIVGFSVFKKVVSMNSTEESGLEENEISKNSAISLFDENILKTLPFRGSDKSEIFIVEFIDYECPDCHTADIIMSQLLSGKYSEKIRVSYYQLPLVDIHPNSLRAAMAVKCAHEQGRFQEMHEKLFSDPTKLNSAQMKLYSVQLDMDTVSFSRCMDESAYIDEITREFESAIALGITRAPTFFIDGKKIEGVPSSFIIEQILDEVLMKTQ